MTHPIRVLIVDDRSRSREGLRALLATSCDIHVVAEATNGQEAISLVDRHYPDVVVMDIRMPVMNGLDATKEICKGYPQAKVLVLTQYDEEENVLASSQVGALGFIPKTAVSSMLLTGIRSVSQGKQFLHSGAR